MGRWFSMGWRYLTSVEHPEANEQRHALRQWRAGIRAANEPRNPGWRQPRPQGW